MSFVATADQADREQSGGSTGVPFRTALLYWLKLGFISFGGPAGQIAIMHTELVERRRWISERRFLHALNYCMLLPGPEAQQLATYIGWLLHGTWGGICAGVLFVLPSVFILMGLSWIYVAFGKVAIVSSIFAGVKPAVVAIIAAAVLRLGSRAIRNGAMLILAAAAFIALWLGAPFPLIIISAGMIGLLGSRFAPKLFLTQPHHAAHADSAAASAVIDDHHEILEHTRPSWLTFGFRLFVGLLLWAVPIAALTAWQTWHGTHTEMAWFFTKAALVTFGGAYAVLPYVAQHSLRVGWLLPGQMIDGLALGETTPGPLIMVTAFVGFVGGWHQAHMGWLGAVLGCLVATYFTFLPSFLFILLGAPFIEQMRGELRLNSILSGITAAVVGVVLYLAVFFGSRVFIGAQDQIQWSSITIAAIAFIALWRFKIDIVRVVLACGLLGALVWLLS